MSQGGNQDAIMKFVQGLAETLQADPKQIVQIAQQNPDALEAAINAFQQTNNMNQAAKVFQQTLQNKIAAAKHGAKLQYLKNLKHQCAEDEEVVYFKNGGSVGCGCQKKKGGEIEKAQNGTKAVSKFKNRKQDQATKDSIAINKHGDEELIQNRPGTWKKNKNYNPKDPNSRTHTWTPDRTKAPYNKEDKVEKEACGSKVVAKFKKHRQGGNITFFTN